MKYILENFDWGDHSQKVIDFNIKEIYVNKIYEKFFEVEENDIVVDIGASNGIFSYSILNKNPKKCFLVEPIKKQVELIQKNINDYPNEVLHGAITDLKYIDEIQWGNMIEKNVKTYTFKEYIEKYNLETIDFLKVDCEGGEYDIFKKENLEFLKKIPKIVIEFHLHKNNEMGLNCKFRYFRDNILKHFNNFKVTSIDGINIEWDLYNEHFLEYYSEVLFYIDNRLKI